MLFNSYIFILFFLPLVLFGYYMMNKLFSTNKPALFLLLRQQKILTTGILLNILIWL